MRPGDVETGPNDFNLGIEGPDPQLNVGGTHDQQELQCDYMLALSTRALASYTTGHTPFTPRWPSDSDVNSMLAGLHRNPPIGTDGRDVSGGTTLAQDARFQGSTKMVGDVQQLASVSSGQHQAWQYAHREIYGQFNGDVDYGGIGPDVFNNQQLSAWGETALNIVKDPGAAADVLVDIGGELANETIDHWGGCGADAMDWANIPGGGVVRQGTDWVGDGVSVVADAGGDVGEFVVDHTVPW
jgi:hypothetical protein